MRVRLVNIGPEVGRILGGGRTGPPVGWTSGSLTASSDCNNDLGVKSAGVFKTGDDEIAAAVAIWFMRIALASSSAVNLTGAAEEPAASSGFC